MPLIDPTSPLSGDQFAGLPAFPDSLKRFTSLPILIDMLVNRSITLLPPTSWEDRSDAHYLNRYKTEKSLQTLLACCFSTKMYTFHHWKVFAGGLSGVCIQFDGGTLLNPIHGEKGLTMRYVQYTPVRKNTAPKLDDWPFLKRKPFEDEGEYRVIYENSTKQEDFKRLPFSTKAITRITLSPWLPKSVAASVTRVIREIKGCGHLTIKRSLLLENPRWQKCVSSRTSRSAGTEAVPFVDI